MRLLKSNDGATAIEYGLIAEQVGESVETLQNYVSHYYMFTGPSSNHSHRHAIVPPPTRAPWKVISRYGMQAHRDRWFKPILEGKAYSTFFLD